MQQIFRKFNPQSWMIAAVFASALFYSCNNVSETKKETTAPAATDKPVEMKKAPDSMPPQDSTTKPRPEPKQT